MTADWIIIDGNNLLHAGGIGTLLRGVSGFDARRRALVRELDGRLGTLAGKITLVFDGVGDSDLLFGGASVEVLFSSAAGSADAVIEKRVTRAVKERFLVVTSDNAVKRAAEAAGSETMSCDAFVELLKDDVKIPSRGAVKARRATLGDFFPST